METALRHYTVLNAFSFARAHVCSKDPEEGNNKALIVLTFTGRLMGKEIDNYFSDCKLTD